MKTDALNRRSRFAKPQPLSRSLVLTERDHVLFEALDRHGKLPTNYLYEFTKHLCKDYSFLQRRLTQLYNGVCDHAEHRAAGFEGNFAHECRAQSYLSRDWQQFNNFEARYQPAVYGITSLAKARLVAEGRGERNTPERNDPFVHQFFGGCFSAAVELSSKPHRFITREAILSHQKCPEATRTAANPFAIPVNDPDVKCIIPDNLIGLEYDGGGFRFFAVEIDRNTETINPRRPVKSSIAKKVRAYLTVLQAKTYASHFGLPNLTILIPTTNAAHLERMVAYIKETVEPRYQGKFLFKAFPTFGGIWRVPRETLDVFAPWRSAVGEVDISKSTSA